MLNTKQRRLLHLILHAQTICSVVHTTENMSEVPGEVKRAVKLHRDKAANPVATQNLMVHCGKPTGHVIANEHLHFHLFGVSFLPFLFSFSFIESFTVSSILFSTKT